MGRPARTVKRRVERGRLAYYLDSADEAFWDQHWTAHLSSVNYAAAASGRLGWFEETFTRYLPRSGRILEAGCGPGQYVLALRARGYCAEGIDWAPEMVTAARRLYPDLPVRLGDVTQLGVPNEYYSGYISLGVVEHRQEGPEPFLTEAHRVLETGGIALISVPYFHTLRKLKQRLGLYRGRTNGMEFYQYAFTDKEFTRLLRAAAFRVIDRMVYDGFKGVKDEIPMLRGMLKWPIAGPRLQQWLRSWKWADDRLGHMILFVCRKASQLGD